MHEAKRIKPHIAAASNRKPASMEPVTSESVTEEPGEKLPWFEQVLSPAPFSYETAGITVIYDFS